MTTIVLQPDASTAHWDAQIEPLTARRPTADAAPRAVNLTLPASTEPAAVMTGADASDPALPAPAWIDSLLMQVLTMAEQASNLAVKALSQQISANSQDHQKLVQQQYDKLQEAAEKLRKQQARKPLGFLGALFTTIGAIILTVATAGGAAPLVGLAVASMVAASIHLIDQTVKLAGGDGFYPIKMIGQAIAKIAQLFGASDEDAQRIANYAVGALALLGAAVAPASIMVTTQAIAGMAAQIGRDAGMSEADAQWLGTGVAIAATLMMVVYTMTACSAADKLASNTANATQESLENAAMVVQGIGQMVSGAATISNAITDYQRAALSAEARKLTAFLMLLRQQMKDLQDSLMEALTAKNATLDTASDIVQSRAASAAAVATAFA